MTRALYRLPINHSSPTISISDISVSLDLMIISPLSTTGLPTPRLIYSQSTDTTSQVILHVSLLDQTKMSSQEEQYERGWGHMFFYVGVFTLFVALFLYLSRQYWCMLRSGEKHKGLLTETTVPTWRVFISRVIPSERYSFLADQEAGLSSNSFSLAGNIASGDSRRGLDDRAKREIKRIMQRDNVTFDQARQAYTQSQFQRNEIGPDGRPMDPKAVFFS